MSTVRFISDLHLGHKNICEFASEQRGGCKNVDEHDKWIVEQWNSVVEKRDLVWVLGDVCFDEKKLPLLKKMNGSKHLILGNHDKIPLNKLNEYFNRIHGFMKYKGFWISHAPIHNQELRGLNNIHGHLHHNQVMDGERPDSRYYCVSVEQLNGKPITLEEIKYNFLIKSVRMRHE